MKLEGNLVSILQILLYHIFIDFVITLLTLLPWCRGAQKCGGGEREDEVRPAGGSRESSNGS